MKKKQEKQKEDRAEGETKLVKMIRPGEVQPKTADVHPDMVEEYKKGGWIVEEEK